MKHTHHPMQLFLAVAFAAWTAACGSDTSITGPDASGAGGSSAGASSSRGATIQGTVRTGAAAAEVGAADVSGIRVSVVGTSLQAMTDGSGRFTITGVPGGRAELRFQGQGIDARLTIEGLVDGQTLTVTVQVNGRTVTRVGEGEDDDDDDGDGDGKVEFEGTISSLSPLTVSGRRVTTNASTRFVGDHNDPMPSSQVLQVGNRVEVEGRSQSDGSILAEKIKLEDNDDEDDNDDNDEQEIEIVGTISALSPLTVAGRRVTTNAQTRFLGDHNDSVPSSQVLQVGNRVEVDGRLQSDSSILAEKIKLKD